MIKKIITTLIGLILGLSLFGAGLVAIAILVTYPKLPSLESVQYYQPKMPLTVYSSDGKVIGLYGEERREFTKIEDFPDVLKNAVIAAEDKRFYDHWGVDVVGVARAVIGNVVAGGVQSGASTITQQVAKNFFLSSERTFTRKFNEALLAYKIEQSLTKDQILELYFNQIYLGQRAYGFAAASQIYFNKNVRELSLAEASMLAGLPKAPSAYNPIVNPERAKLRQAYILNNMFEEGMITMQQRDQAMKEKLHYERFVQKIDQSALYVAEMVRQELYEKYGEDAYTQGFKVYTTVSTEHQKVATAALRKALRNFDRGSSYRGAEDFIDLSQSDNIEETVGKHLSTLYTVDGMIPAVVVDITRKNNVVVQLPSGRRVTLGSGALGFAARAVNNKKMGDDRIRKGSVIRVKGSGDQWRVVQEPLLQGALVSLDAKTGAVRALVGGYDYHSKTFNRATQAMRQPGSTFKPFVYSAALAKGMTASTQINDAPIVLPGKGAGGKAWAPKNADGRYAGYITLRQALTASKNMVSIRILMSIGVGYAQQYIQRFGFKPSEIPATLSMALGTGETTPLRVAEGYTVFANGGYKVSAHVIDKIYDSQGRLRAQMQPLVAGENAPQAIDPRNAYIMYKIMQDVVRSGTARGAAAVGRSDIAGKTGTTNDNKDAWFVGFNPSVVTAVYIGFDKPRSMGRAGYGGTIAVPVWVDYMKFALKGTSNKGMKAPEGLVSMGGEYYMKERQTTSSELTLDNRGSVPRQQAAPRRSRPANNAKPQEQSGGGTPVAPKPKETPVNPTNSGGSRQLDALF
ncbi:penicillin-binding protein 1A [Neisseria animalis]|uniref:Penicillin-binding protein 1A n=1 Tax=Neisseria animalis TaxID=492 RepID=A0A5P3MRQ3_NEIAN|nr:penicillin-binding protein 1A [Neisseria animalis]QEY24272.1 penicillin-binding protein 1A [Neisseria animalis]ROW32322.1 penicillin-binding protein 1A [Neisseria animalis]VEE06665.1 protein PonA [Neisseria animalis]